MGGHQTTLPLTHSYYEVLTCILSLSPWPSTHPQELRDSITIKRYWSYSPRFLIVVAGERAKSVAKNLVSIVVVNRESDLDELNDRGGGGNYSCQARGRRQTRRRRSRKNDISFKKRDRSSFPASGTSWLCGQYAETFRARAIGKAPLPIICVYQ